MFALGVVSSVIFFVACPFKSYIVDKKLIPLLPLEIIFVDQSTFAGFAVANTIISGLGMFAGLGTILYGAVFIYAIRMYSLLVNLIIEDFKDLDNMWADASTASLRHKQLLLRNICNKQQDIKEYREILSINL